VRLQAEQTESIPGNSTDTPTTIARARPMLKAGPLNL
jgi:hypothetical protein